MKRTIAVLALCVAMLGACDPVQGGSKPAKAPTAGAQPKNESGQQPAPVEGDPSAHNTQPGEIDLHVEWTSENSTTPVCEWSKNGVSQPCANMARGVKEGRDYIGFWEHSEMGKAGDVFTVTAQGNPGVKSIDCAVFWKGTYHAGTTNGRRCGISFTLN